MALSQHFSTFLNANSEPKYISINKHACEYYVIIFVCVLTAAIQRTVDNNLLYAWRPQMRKLVASMNNLKKMRAQKRKFYEYNY